MFSVNHPAAALIGEECDWFSFTFFLFDAPGSGFRWIWLQIQAEVKLKHAKIKAPYRLLMLWGLQCVSSPRDPPPVCQWSKYKYIMSPLPGGSSLSGSQRGTCSPTCSLWMHSRTQSLHLFFLFFFFVTWNFNLWVFLFSLCVRFNTKRGRFCFYSNSIRAHDCCIQGQYHNRCCWRTNWRSRGIYTAGVSLRGREQGDALMQLKDQCGCNWKIISNVSFLHQREVVWLKIASSCTLLACLCLIRGKLLPVCPPLFFLPDN